MCFSSIALYIGQVSISLPLLYRPKLICIIITLSAAARLPRAVSNLKLLDGNLIISYTSEFKTLAETANEDLGSLLYPNSKIFFKITFNFSRPAESGVLKETAKNAPRPANKFF
ncbi:hypothetical protein D4R78_08455 [bacterium]|nr:MAG: hypothetical protein D4R78_08455 [bacterium]